ncbi:glycosyltransferase family 4 protein [Pseudohaliea sp.]|uniref:glycosyltransferase family 4 protein n=1 Tax=Pseudohaliea sp. TaxID=2740289 RepID=UPI0032EECDB2
MKLLTAVCTLDKGGTQRAAQNFAEAYRALGHDSRIVYTIEGGTRASELVDRGVPVYDLGNAGDRARLAAWDPELLHLHSHRVSEEAFRALRSLAPRAPVVETNVFSIPSPWAGELRASFQLAGWCQFLYQQRCRGAHPSVVVPYPVRCDGFHPVPEQERLAFRERWGLGREHRVLGRVGQAFNSKWSPWLLEVFEELRRGDPLLRLIMINPPPEMLARREVSPYRGDVVVIDELRGDAALSACYSAMDVFLHISRWGESFGMVLAESLLCETPVVTLATPWADNAQGEVVGDGVGGHVARRVSQLTPLVRQLLDNPKQRAAMGQRGRERVLQRFDHLAVARAALARAMVGTPGRSAVPAGPAELPAASGFPWYCYRLLARVPQGLRLLQYTSGFRPWRLLLSAAWRRLLGRLPAGTQP